MLPTLALLLFPVTAAPVEAPAIEPQYEVYAVQYASVPDFPVASLVPGADPSRHVDIAMMFWVMVDRPARRVLLLDAGFYRESFLRDWKPRDFMKPSDAVRLLGFAPEDVTDILVSHSHWDHVDGEDLFPKARVWIQKDEYEYYTGEAWQPEGGKDPLTPEGREALEAKHGGVFPEDVLALVGANVEGRLRFVRGDDQEVAPGIRCYTGGKHTYQSQYCSVSTRSGTVVLASDNMYLYENLETRAPIAQTLDPGSNLRAQDRMRQLASKPGLIVPGHDAQVMLRFPKVADRVVRID